MMLFVGGAALLGGGGMTKNSDATVPSLQAEMAGWTPDAGSTLSGNALVVSGARTGVKVGLSAMVRRTTISSRTARVFIYINGAQSAATAATSLVTNNEWQLFYVETGVINLANGALITVQTVASGSNVAMQGGTSWCRIL